MFIDQVNYEIWLAVSGSNKDSEILKTFPPRKEICEATMLTNSMGRPVHNVSLHQITREHSFDVLQLVNYSSTKPKQNGGGGS